MQRITLAFVSATLLHVYFLAQPAWGQLPEFYKTVSHVQWVVKDLDRVTAGWSRLGFKEIQQHGILELKNAEFQDKRATLRLRRATARLGGLDVEWVQPLGGRSAYTEFLNKHGDGIFSLVHRVPTQDSFKQELALLCQAGLDVIQRESYEGSEGAVKTAYLDTEEGGYVLGLTCDSRPTPCEVPAGSADNPYQLQHSQFAFVVRDPEPVSLFWKRVGFPELSLTHGILRDRSYRGQPGFFDQELGWQRHGKVVYEWCIPLKGPTVYEDHLQLHGEGVHHLGFQVKDLDSVVRSWKALGFEVSQSGAWGEDGKPGSGRFAYVDTDEIGGVTVELLWNYK
jgi:catechol 2,3-dioxygenase-like lactoylglutathione lyase family enzyme